MIQPNCPHFHAGKQARADGKPFLITDARLKGTSRQSWYDGWNFQDAQMRPQPTEEEIQQNDSFFKGLKNELRKGA